MAETDTRSLTFARSSSLDVPLSLRIASLAGKRPKRPLLDLVKEPALRLAGVQQPGPSDLIVVCQLWSDNKPLSLPVRTAHKSFTTSYAYVSSRPQALHPHTLTPLETAGMKAYRYPSRFETSLSPLSSLSPSTIPLDRPLRPWP